MGGFAVDLDRGAASALYRQIAEQLKARILRGDLAPGMRLPTIRELSHSLRVTRLTAQNAYAELQSAGLIESTVGRGTFVATHIQPEELVTTVGAQLTPEAVMADLIRVGQIPGLRNMAIASADTSMLPMDEFWSSVDALRRDDSSVMEYAPAQGDPQLRGELAAWLSKRGTPVMPDHIVLTSGATHGLSLAAQVLARTGDAVLVEQPTYLGFLNIAQAHGLRPVGVPVDDDGIQLDALERAIAEHRPAFLYMTGSFHNPTGHSLSPGRQRDLLAISRRHRLPILEDDIYWRLSYDGPPPPSLKSQDADDLVIYVESFSKIFMPSLRIGFAVAPRAWRDRLIAARVASDLCGVTVIQRAMSNVLQTGKLEKHLGRMAPVYRSRRDTLVNVLRQWMPEGVKWTVPKGGFSCWLTLPDGGEFDGLYRAALARGLVYTPGSVFMAQPDGRHHLRLCFGNQSVELIRDGVMLLAELIRSAMRDSGTSPRQVDCPPLV